MSDVYLLFTNSLDKPFILFPVFVYEILDSAPGQPREQEGKSPGRSGAESGSLENALGISRMEWAQGRQGRQGMEQAEGLLADLSLPSPCCHPGLALGSQREALRSFQVSLFQWTLLPDCIKHHPVF